MPRFGPDDSIIDLLSASLVVPNLVRQTIRVARRAGGVRCEGLAEPSHLSEQPDLGPEAGEGLRSRLPPGAGPPRRRCAASRTAAFVLSLHVMQSHAIDAIESQRRTRYTLLTRAKLANAGIAGIVERLVGGLQRIEKSASAEYCLRV